jgi:carboxyl-terminal processing protease
VLSKKLIDFAEEKEVVYNNKQFKESKHDIRILLKAYIGNIVFDNDGFYPIFHQIDETFKKAMEHLTSEN